MTLLVSTVAAIVCTLLWYQLLGREDYKLGTLALMFWGASLMWFVDAVVEYMEMGAEYFVPEAGDMLNDFFLGLCVVALGMIIWMVILFMKDPQGKIRRALVAKE